jgi:hypothetical protein|tara:strand:+ start:567 stop:722 length:156 start_codon:yes stop_codon:yes gene_type:complete
MLSIGFFNILLVVHAQSSDSDFDDLDASIRLLAMQIINFLLVLEWQTLSTL